MDEVIPALCAGLCCFAMYGLGAGGAGWLVHLRMRRVEAELGRPALPDPEVALLLYAGASVVWLSAAVIAAVGLFKREWTRAGRNSFFVLLAHFAILTAAAVGVTVGAPLGAPAPVLLVGMACAIVLGSAVMASGFLWRWGSARIARLEARPPTGDPPGIERWAIYAGALVIGMVGLFAPLLYKEPQNVRVGVTAMRIGVAHLMGIVVLVCVGLPILTAVALPDAALVR
jgi:hypothetical protein